MLWSFLPAAHFSIRVCNLAHAQEKKNGIFIFKVNINNTMFSSLQTKTQKIIYGFQNNPLTNMF